jgi:hypothetical protein
LYAAGKFRRSWVNGGSWHKIENIHERVIYQQNNNDNASNPDGIDRDVGCQDIAIAPTSLWDASQGGFPQRLPRRASPRFA